MAAYVVTGAAGFIGARVSGMLLEEGHTVIGLDNLNDAYDVRLKQYRLEQLKRHAAFQFHQVDISDLTAVEPIAAGAGKLDGIINLAARAGVRSSVENPWLYLQANTTGALNMLELCRRYSIPKFVQASTSSIYGENPPLPTPETADSDHPLQPYAATKKGAEAMAHAYHYLHGIDVTIFRYFTVYGPAGRPDMVMFRFCQWIAEGKPVMVNGDGKQSRGFTYVDDIARGTILGLKPVGYEIINLGGHEVITINDLIHIMESYLGKPAQVAYTDRHKADVSVNNAAVDKARQMLGWQPQVELRDGIKRLVDWYLQERAWVSQVPTP
jgi:nucleoside-diphosphate-sugar epimerase